MTRTTTSFRVTIFWPTWSRPSGDEFSRRFRLFFEKEAARMEKRYNKITGTWQQKNQPHWQVEYFSDRKNFGFRHFTLSEVMVYLAEGTSKRWALMDKDFIPKTRRKRFGSYGAGGEPVARGKRLRRSRKGIDAREWHYQLAQDLSRSARLSKEFQKTFDAIAREYGDSGKKTKKQRVTFEV